MKACSQKRTYELYDTDKRVLSRSPEMPLGLRFPNVLGGGAGGTHVPRAVLQLANEILEVADADWSRAIWITCARDGRR